MAPKDNLTCVLYGVKDLRVEQRPIPEITDDQVLIEMDCIGICGTDIHFIEHGRCGPFPQTKPVIMGHESSGLVYKLGKNVKHLKVGDRVVIEPIAICHTCEFCRAGKYNLCAAQPLPSDGNMTRYYAHPGDMTFKIPDNVTMEEGALVEPIAVAVWACQRVGVTLGSEVLVLGAGPIGLVTVLVAKAMGATKIMITDLVQERLDVAKKVGADYTLKIEKGHTEPQIVEIIQKTMGKLPNITFDCCGVEHTARLAIAATHCGGVIGLVGNGPGDVKVPLVDALNKELDIRGCFRYANTYPASIDMLAKGLVNAKPLITHHYDITEAVKAFDHSGKGTDGAIKVFVFITFCKKCQRKSV